MHVKIYKIMGRHHLSCSLISFYILLFFLFIHHITASNNVRELLVEPLEANDDPCLKVDCGQGKCVVSSGSLLGFDCLCNHGWNKMQLGPFLFPACTVPNCTISSQCGNAAPTPLPPPPPANPLTFDLLNPCNFVWCGDGSCVQNQNGLGYYCKCNDGSANLFNITGVACMKECFLGANCNEISFGSPPLIPPPSPGKAFASPASSSPPSKNSGGTSSSVSNCSTNRGHAIKLLLCLIFLLVI